MNSLTVPRFLPFFLFTIAWTGAANAQLKSELTTDKSDFAYGETIAVIFTLTNETQELVTTSAACPPVITFDGVEFGYACVTAEIYYYFNPDSWRSWTFEIDPAESGFPTFTGEHSVSIAYESYSESVVLTAPAYLGGMLSVEFIAGTPLLRVDEIRASLNGETVHSRTRPNGNLLEAWRVSSIRVGDAVALYENDPAVANIYAEDPFADYTSVDTERPDEVPLAVDVRLYPNPAIGSASLEYSVLDPSDVEIQLFDATGRIVRRVAEGFRGPGSYTRSLDLGDMPSGVYIYRIRVGTLTAARSFVILR